MQSIEEKTQHAQGTHHQARRWMNLMVMKTHLLLHSNDAHHHKDAVAKHVNVKLVPFESPVFSTFVLISHYDKSPFAFMLICGL